MRFTVGVAFLFTGSLLASIGLAVPSGKHPGAELSDVATIVILWLLSILILLKHEKIFRRDRIVTAVIPVLAVAFVLLLIDLGRIMSFGIADFNLYAVLLGWCFFNSGLYYDTNEVLKADKR